MVIDASIAKSFGVIARSLRNAMPMANGVQPLCSGLALPASRAEKSSSGISTALAYVRAV